MTLYVKKKDAETIVRLHNTKASDREGWNGQKERCRIYLSTDPINHIFIPADCCPGCDHFQIECQHDKGQCITLGDVEYRLLPDRLVVDAVVYPTMEFMFEGKENLTEYDIDRSEWN